ncbi:peroxiredoxin 2, putative [Ichthyophthirius multifiliis]|uniref:Peroxiredoxin 2, putative n=1 Tax=Ichthyophthirius multifiliis TaxID=5932 RepID=G0R691_ICHMU|nr:peroxiredoxin 2, putative [Ichthyophthirius multifiliis]EGR27018.1 peroxiredoxin 2, putative [Ichthyophthirius multifiliis]|eukprot:XP_004023902.1 peroxiredoxin 2, putative [Ichthyophthirius multifiliis]
MTSKAFLGQKAPEFSTVSVTDKFEKISLSDFEGKWLLLFFYPNDFGFVCPTEILQFSNHSVELKKINCEVLGCSIGSQFQHHEWLSKPKSKGGIANLQIPLLVDITQQICRDYGTLIPNGPRKGSCYRGTFIIDPRGIIRHISINDIPVGRNVDEIVRLIQGYQFYEEFGEMCPAKWKPHTKSQVPKVDQNKLKQYWENEHFQQ